MLSMQSDQAGSLNISPSSGGFPGLRVVSLRDITGPGKEDTYVQVCDSKLLNIGLKTVGTTDLGVIAPVVGRTVRLVAGLATVAVSRSHPLHVL